MRARILILAMLATCLAATPARAHKPSDSYLLLDGAAVALRTGTWDIALRDLDDVLRLDTDGDGAITVDEVNARSAAIGAYALAHLTLATGTSACAITTVKVEIVEHSDGAYARLPLRIACPAASANEAPTLDYRLLFDVDPQHRAIVRVANGGNHDTPIVLTARDHVRSLPFTVAASPGFASFVAQGARHIAAGLDHLLFLLALLLPAVLRRDAGVWQPASSIRSVLADVGKIVTAFTLAHSLTLTLAVLGWARMPARLTEPAIAASVVIAALNNLRPLFGRDRWVVAFALGLLHGFGFSSALSDAGLGGAALAPTLLGFNLGVELGQLALVALFVPLAFLARATAFYRRFTLPAGSTAIVALAAIWFIERTADLRLLPWRL
ncbi:MAG TPA: HupE/UreJ family protein [Polyangia bacterium]|jgi:hypothetical protein|nr:HupE/UreJ family protein [Polyangia bacterium]